MTMMTTGVSIKIRHESRDGKVAPPIEIQLLPVAASDDATAISFHARGRLEHLATWEPSGREQLVSAAIDLLLVAIGDSSGCTADAPAQNRRQAMLLRTYAWIEERLSDPDLSPSSVAAAQFVSLRSLYELFETEQLTVGEWIRRRRLERCAHDMRDPALAGQSISAIAARWGITNPAHFSRLFRAHYGVPPSEYRANGGRPHVPRSTPRIYGAG